MTLPLNPETIAALYEYARSLPPFSALKKMPHADDVEFRVVKDRTRFGWYQRVRGRHRISVSIVACGHTTTLVNTIGHEMIHLYLSEAGLESGGNENVHNSAFRKLAARFCKIHGVDPKAFF